MTSTFVNDLRLNEQGTGDNPGSWGTVTNTNLELIAEAFSYGTETIGNADTTITMQDGTSDAARSLYLKIASSADLTTTRVITLAPNDVSKVWIIENATSGGQVITIKQGTGATINIANGQTKMIATDGAGSGGIVYDLLQDLAVPDLFVDDDLTLQSDGAIINFGADSDITLTHAADTSLTLGGAGSTTGLLINNTATDGDPFLSFALSGTQTFTMGVDDGDSDKFKIGTTAIGTNTRLTIDSSGNVGIGESSPSAQLHISGTDTSDQVIIENTDTGSGSAPDLVLFRNSASPVDNDVIGRIDFRGEDDGSTARNYTSIESKIVNVAASTPTGAIHFKTLNASTTEADVLVLSGNTATFSNTLDVGTITTSALASLRLKTAGSNNALALNIEENSGNEGWGLGVNAAGDLKFYNSTAGTITGNSAVTFSDNDKVGIGTADPSAGLTLEGADGNTNATFLLTSTGVASAGLACDANGLNFGADTGGFRFKTGASANDPTDTGTLRFRVDGNGVFNIGEYGNQTVAGQVPQAQVAGDSSVETTLCITRLENNANPPALHFAKTRSTSTGSFSIVSAGDNLGKIEWHGDDGTDMSSCAAEISCIVGSGPSGNDMPGILKFMTTAPDAVTPTERMRIKETGEILLTLPDEDTTFAPNTDSTWNRFEIFQDRGATNTASGIAFRSQSATAPAGIASVAGNTTGGIESLVFMTSTGNNTGERMRIHAAGNVKIGENTDTLNSNPPLEIERNESSNDTCIRTKNPSTNSRFHIDFLNSSGSQGNVTVNSGSVNFNSTSDYRKKENVNYTWDGTTELKKLKPAKFNFIGDSDTIQGFLAHEVSDIVPTAVTGEKDAVDADGNPKYQSMDVSKLVPLLVKTIQELEARIAKLEGA